MASVPSPAPRRHPTPPLAGRALPLALGLCFALGCQSGSGARNQAEEVEDLIADGRFPEAVERSARLAQERPGDPAADELWRRASGAYWLDEGRRLIFEDRQAEAVPALQRALALLPESEHARHWELKVRRELAMIERLAAFEAEASGEFDEARAHYSKALEYWPGDPQTVLGKRRVAAIEAYFGERSSEYYNEGVTALRELRTAEAIQRFQAALKYEPESEAGLLRQEEVNLLLAEERCGVGQELEDLGLFRAARAEYRMARSVEPDYAPANEGFERTDVEVRVLELLSDADQELRAKDFPRALELFDQALELTRLQSEQVAQLRARADEERVTYAYERALLLEQDFRYPDAIRAYDALLAEQVGGYLDARARRETLAGYILDAERLYQQAMASEDLEQQLALLRQIELIWPTYADVQRRLRQLERAAGPKG
jgi:tetratricopeptide (TPR) repeat protein